MSVQGFILHKIFICNLDRSSNRSNYAAFRLAAPQSELAARKDAMTNMAFVNECGYEYT